MFLFFISLFLGKMNVNTKEKKSIVMQEKLLKYQNVYGLFKNLFNICKMLLADQYFDNCYCNLTFKQCWLCNLANYVRHNKIKDDLVRYRKREECLIDIAYRFVYYIKRIKKEQLNYADEKLVLDFFKQKFSPLTSFDEIIKADVKTFKQSNY